MQNVVSLSGGKDSTAMLLHMIDRGEKIADIVFFDTGWEFPQLYAHLEHLERMIGRRITRLRPRLPLGVQTDKTPFDWMYSEYPMKGRKTGTVDKIGRGWAAPMRRWCTGKKQEALKAHVMALTYRYDVSLPVMQCIGFAADEADRIEGSTKAGSTFIKPRNPLIEWGWTEGDALQYCYDKGLYWGGLYKFFSRLSCFCCPLQPLAALRTLRWHFPELWARMLQMESWLPEGDKGRRFRKELTVSDLEKRFAGEDVNTAQTLVLPGIYQDGEEQCQRWIPQNI